MNTRRSFLKLLTLLPVAALVPKPKITQWPYLISADIAYSNNRHVYGQCITFSGVESPQFVTRTFTDWGNDLELANELIPRKDA